MTLVAPGVDVTACVTAPFESSVSAWPAASVAPPRTIFLNVARVPELSGRMISTIASSGPPTSFQLVVLPVQMSVACCVVRFVTPVTSVLVTMIQPCLRTGWSTNALASGDASLLNASTSEFPIWNAPAETCVRPVPEPPPCTSMAEPAQPASYDSLAASTTGCMAVEPPAMTLPCWQSLTGISIALPAGDGDAASDSAALCAAALGPEVLGFVVALPVPPHAATSTPTASVAPANRNGLFTTCSLLCPVTTSVTVRGERQRRVRVVLTLC